MADACFIVHLFCLFMKTHVPALLQDYCLDLGSLCFLAQVVCMREEYKSVLSTPTEADTRLLWPIPIYRQNPDIGLSLVMSS